MELKTTTRMISILLLAIFSTLPVTNAQLLYWKVVPNPIEDTATALTSVFIIDVNDGWAVGWGGNILYWDGSSWSVVPSPTSYDLFSVYMINSNDGWIVGAGGTILHCDGVSWNTVPSPTGQILR